MKVNICGITHEVIELESGFDADAHFGKIDYLDTRIKINKTMSPGLKESTITHEMLHGILMHCGYDELANDEKFVRTIGNAIFQGFNVRIID